MKMQTLAQVNPRASYEFDPKKVALKRMRVQARIAHAISIWSTIEALTANIILHALHGDMRAAVHMYAAITSATASNAALKAAIRTGLRPEYAELFDAIWQIGGELVEDRHRLAHWIMGYSEEIPNAVLLFNPRDGLKRGAHNISVGRLGQPDQFTPRPLNKIRVASVEYLDDLRARLLGQMHRIMAFMAILEMYETDDDVDAAAIDERYRRLCTEPRIRHQLDSGPGGKNRPKAQQRRRSKASRDHS
jgi:hypothetical protein